MKERLLMQIFLPETLLQSRITTTWFLPLPFKKSFQKQQALILVTPNVYSGPGIQQLNPYVDQHDPNFITYAQPWFKTGNQPYSPAHNYSLFKNVSVNAAFLSYSFSNNTIQAVSIFGADGITRGTFENIGTNNNLEADLNINYPLRQTVKPEPDRPGWFYKIRGNG